MSDNPAVKVIAKKKIRAGKPAKSQRGSDTRKRIIERSIALFNQRGVQQVAIEQIAADLAMSPGNITYYFPFKRHLIHATLDHLKVRLRQSLEAQSVTAVHDAGEYVIGGIRTLWDFRFFFNSLVFLLADDPELRQEYAEFRHWAIGAVVEDLSRLVQIGFFFAPAAPNSLQLLADNMWSQWLSWLRGQQIESPRAMTPSNQALYDCALHLWSLCQPHLEPRFSRQLIDELQSLLTIEPQAVTAFVRRRRSSQS